MKHDYNIELDKTVKAYEEALIDVNAIEEEAPELSRELKDKIRLAAAKLFDGETIFTMIALNADAYCERTRKQLAQKNISIKKLSEINNDLAQLVRILDL